MKLSLDKLPIIILALLMSCAPPQATSSFDQRAQAAQVKTTKRILVICADGYDNSIDTVGMNKILKDMYNGISPSLQSDLTSHNKNTTCVLDQNPKYSPGQKLAIHGTKNNADAAIIITVESTPIPNTSNDFIIDFVLKYCDLVPIIRNNDVIGVTPTNMLSKKYNLYTGSQKGPDLSFNVISKDFMQFLASHSRI